jgi:serum/glucocorticoid-regulated kinase 2
VAYRDLKPENILMDKYGHVKLIDFGLSKLKMRGNNMTYSVVGTIEYMAPEILVGGGYTKACDWWSLGIVLYEMVQGTNPYRNNDMTVREKSITLLEQDFIINDNWSPELKDLLSKLFKRDPRERIGGSSNMGF